MRWRDGYMPPCERIDPELWFPETGRSDTARMAVAWCRRCRVQRHCLDEAMAAEESLTSRKGRSGIFGGLTPQQRTDLALEGRKVTA